jgi:MFS family permease
MLAGVRALLRDNAGYRRLWMAQAVSLTGDWFTLIALAVLVSRDTRGSGLAVSILALVQILPWVVMGPWSGVLADRFDRKRLLVASDVARAMVVLLLIPAAEAGRPVPVLALALVHFTVTTVFEPARSALVPRLVEPRELVTATTLSSVTWSVMLAFGGALGGSVLSRVGVRTAFLIDALTFVGSAVLILGIHPAAAARDTVTRAPVAFRDGIRWAIAHPPIGAAALVKTINGVAVVDTFIVLYATRVFAVGEGGAIAVGLLMASFGVGAILGPALLNRWNDGSVRRMRRLVVVSSVLICVGIFVLSGAGSLGGAALGILLRGMGGSANWTFSTIILQKSVPDRLLGRLSALDLVIANLVAMAFALTWGATIDRAGLRTAVLGAAVATVVPLVLWTASLPALERQEAREGSRVDAAGSFIGP